MHASQIRPLLAAMLVPGTEIRFPILVSRKLDGYRLLTPKGIPQTRNGKAPANRRANDLLRHPLLANLDGEAIVGLPFGDEVFNRTTRILSTHEADIDDVTFWVFDSLDDLAAPFTEKSKRAREQTEIAKAAGLAVEFVEQVLVHNLAKLDDLYRTWIAEGYEGQMIRSLDGAYKTNRSTLREGILIKRKQVETAEAVVIGVEPLYRNLHEKVANELGYANRSSAQAGKVADDLLGALVVEDFTTGVRFSIGTGFTQEQREALWAERESLPGRLVSFKSMLTGVVSAPRHPIFVRFRDANDVGGIA